MTEAQQDQDIAEIKKRHEIDCHWIAIYGSSQLLSDLGKTLKIVKCKVQKIEEQAKEIERLKHLVKAIDPEREP